MCACVNAKSVYNHYNIFTMIILIGFNVDMTQTNYRNIIVLSISYASFYAGMKYLVFLVRELTLIVDLD